MTNQVQPPTKDPRWTAVDAYSFAHLHPSTRSTPSTGALTHALTTSAAHGLPDIAVSASQGKYLQLQARLVKARHVLEVGTLGGYSALWLAHASADVRIVSVEVDAHHAAIARENLAHAGVANRVEVRVGAGVDVLPRIREEVEMGTQGKFQLVFIDADKENNWNYVDVAIGMCEPGACIIVDNVVRKGQLAVESDDPRIAGARRVVEMVGRDERLDGVVMQTVGEKSYDGFLIAVVK